MIVVAERRTMPPAPVGCAGWGWVDGFDLPRTSLLGTEQKSAVSLMTAILVIYIYMSN